MTAHEPQLQELDIQQGFAAFIDAAKRLEESYALLKERAQAIDLQLAESNRQLEQTLLEREMILRSLPVGVFARNSPGEMIWCNPEAHRLIEAAGKHEVDLTGQADGELEVGELSLRLQRVELPDGGVLLVVEDRSRVVRLEREVDRLDRLAGLSELALGIAHEIKNPLNGVMGFGALMARTDDVGKIKGFAGKVNDGLQQVDAIVKELLAFARPAEGASRQGTVEQIVAEAAAAASIPRACVTLETGGGLCAEASSLVRVLGNLFRNSAEAADGDVRIRVRATRREDHLELIVSDDGPGVPEELANKVFQPFVSSKDRGHGLGLALACRVLSFLNGSIELCNPGERGAVFKVCVRGLQR